ncbi:MAG: type II secretion system GspH family protein [Rhodothermia bacterium]|nr:type II secretion system GspH family protein [Rhodothermia bacterium]
MSQSQFMLIVLGIVIVGIAAVLAVRGFGEGRKKANLDALSQDAYEVAVDAIRWMRKPEFFGGGGDTCAAARCDWTAATLEKFGYGAESDGSLHTYHGMIEIDPASDPENLVIRGTNPELGNQVVIRITGAHPDSVYTVIDPEYTP